MEDKLALANQRLKSSWLAENRLDEPSSGAFVLAVTKMALAKNVKLVDGTLNVWEECMLEDIQKGEYTLEDFIAATKRVIREPVYNRIDFADIYKLAKEDNHGKHRSTIAEDKADLARILAGG